MPDRDPALEAALSKWRKDIGPGAPEFGFTKGYHAAFRSLGCATPEAQAALRELVTAICARMAAYDEWMAVRLHGNLDDTVEQSAALISLGSQEWERTCAFVKLATPPEEGR